MASIYRMRWRVLSLPSGDAKGGARGPFGASTFMSTVRDGEIVRAGMNWEIEKFSPRMWEPFADWVSTNYPEDAAVMYNETLTDFQLTEESIRLWERNTKRYVKEV